MAELKTKPNSGSVEKYLNTIKEKQKREDSFAILELMKKATKEEPRMWGASLVGFGDVHMKYESGRELDWFKVGFAPRKESLSLYLSESTLSKKELLDKLGKHATGVGCLYIDKLEDVNVKVLKELIETSVKKK